MTEQSQPRIALGRRVELIIGPHLGNVTGVQQGRFQVTFDGGMSSEGGRARRRSGGRYWYPLSAAARFKVLK